MPTYLTELKVCIISTNTWNIKLVQAIFNYDETHAILTTPILPCTHEYSLISRMFKFNNGIYSVKRTYKGSVCK